MVDIPKLSVLIPTYNREDCISRTINSVLHQEFKDFELICSDNSSKDRTYEILREFSRKDSRIIVFRNNKNLGPVLNWKKCLDKAKGDYIHWLWSDDWIEPNFYTDAFNLMEQDGTNAVLTWTYISANQANLEDKYIGLQFPLSSVPSKIAAKKMLLFSNEMPLSPAAYILPRDLVKDNFYLDIPKVNDKLDPVTKGVGVDSLMVIGTCQNINTLSVLQKPSVVFRMHDNISTQLTKDGSLAKMYFIAHIWYISNNGIALSFKQLIMLLLRVLKRFKFTVFSPNLRKPLLKIVVQSIDVPPLFVPLLMLVQLTEIG